MKHRLTINPRLCETDLNGHINNTSVMPWLEEGRLQLCRAKAGISQPTVLAHLSTDYRAEIEYGAPVDVVTWIEKLGNSSISYRQQILQQQQLCLEATAVSVAFNPGTRNSEPLSDESRRRLENWVESAV